MASSPSTGIPGAANSPETRAVGVRATYDALPAAVRSWIDRELGSSVVSASSQEGGFSPGVAARLVTASGRRAFVKAVGTPLNPESPGLHRRERTAMEAIPPLPWLPHLLSAYDDGDWVALLYEDIEGRQPHHPWTPDETDRVFGALTELSAALTPSPWADAPRLEVSSPSFREGWTILADAPPDDLDPWSRAHLPELAELQRRWHGAARGDALTHWDIRADNILLATDGRVVFVDWAWACRAAPWVDTAVATLDLVISRSEVDPDALLRRHPRTRDADPDTVTALLAALAGTLTERSRAPAPPGLPTIRTYQRMVSHALIAWTRRRTGWE